jgi:hypothetical protein
VTGASRWFVICRDIALANEQAIVEAQFGRLIEAQKNYLG